MMQSSHMVSALHETLKERERDPAEIEYRTVAMLQCCNGCFALLQWLMRSARQSEKKRPQEYDRSTPI